MKAWQAPALSSLVNRLAQPVGAQPHPTPVAQPKPKQEQHYLNPSSSDDEEQEAAPAEPEVSVSNAEGGLSIYTAAAGPLRSLLACFTTEPGDFSLAPVTFSFALMPVSAQNNCINLPD